PERHADRDRERESDQDEDEMLPGHGEDLGEESLSHGVTTSRCRAIRGENGEEGARFRRRAPDELGRRGEDLEPPGVEEADARREGEGFQYVVRDEERRLLQPPRQVADLPLELESR